MNDQPKLVHKQKLYKMVGYHNQFGSLIIPDFRCTQANIFFYLLHRIKNLLKDKEVLINSKGNEYINLTDKDVIVITIDQLEDELSINNKHKKWLIKECQTVIDQVRTMQLIPANDQKHPHRVDHRMMFERVIDDLNDHNYMCFKLVKDSSTLLLFTRLTSDVCWFTLKDYYYLTTKYSKALFRYISQYANSNYRTPTGQHFLDIPKDELCAKLHISKNSSFYKQGNIKSKIINPALNKLNVFFKNIHVRVKRNITDKNNPTIIHKTVYEFTWDKDLRHKNPKIKTATNSTSQSQAINDPIQNFAKSLE